MGAMGGRSDPRTRSGLSRLGLISSGVLATLVVELAALAQPAPPAAPTAPAAPALPGPPKVPEVPAAPSVPSPTQPSLPPQPPSGRASASPPDAGVAGASSPLLPPPRDSDVVLFDSKPTNGDASAGTATREERSSALVERPLRTEDTASLAVDTLVVSASNRKEGSRSAIGSVIVLTARDLRVRGYTDLSQMLDDLPGMDVIRPGGDVYVRSYIRGNRTVGAEPYLLMIDGVVYNQLFTGSAQILAALPLSDVERVEIVYGPLSSVHGPNAALGVINVLTTSGGDRQEAGTFGGSFSARVGFGGPQPNFTRFEDTTKLVDASASYVARDYRIRVTTRLESSVFDTEAGQRSDLPGLARYRNPSAWGAGTLQAYPTFAGSFHSPDRKGAVDARLVVGRTEIAGQLFTLSTGYGVEYPGDRRQTSGLFTGRELSVHARHLADLTAGVVSSTMIQYRRSDIDATSLTNDTGSEVKLLSIEAPSSAAVVQEDLEINARQGLFRQGDQLGFGVGLRYQHLTLPGGALGKNVISSTTWAPTEDPTQAAKVGPDQAAGAPVPGKPFDAIGAYFLAKYAFNAAHAINLGLRVDKSSAREDINVSFRGGYAGTFVDRVTLKLWYGHSIFEPSYQEDLAATAATKAPPTLAVDHLHTVEGDIDFTLPFLALHLDGYFVYTTNPVVAVASTSTPATAFTNAGDRRLAGVDAGARLQLAPFNAWAYYSHAFSIDDGRPNVALVGDKLTTDGDIASDKIWAGLTVAVGPFTGTLLNRWILGREVVATNSSGAPPWYTLLDANLMLSDIPADGLWFALRATNIIGTHYDHPGIQTADSGDMSGEARSGGPFSSRLPQPGRTFFAMVGYTHDPERPQHGR